MGIRVKRPGQKVLFGNNNEISGHIVSVHIHPRGYVNYSVGFWSDDKYLMEILDAHLITDDDEDDEDNELVRVLFESVSKVANKTNRKFYIEDITEEVEENKDAK